jgi:imidazolonepropionase-like amidohydrolase
LNSGNTIAAIIESEQTGRQYKASNIQQSEAPKFDASGKIVTPGLIDMHIHFQFISRNIPF